MIKVGIIGGTGYTAQELLRLLYMHPHVKVEFLTSRETGNSIDELYPNLTGCYDLPLVQYSPALFDTVDVVFIALPHGLSAEIVQDALQYPVKIIDLGADFRFEIREMYQDWYKIDAPKDELLSQALYGLPELHREQIKGKKLIANPGCYVTCSILTLAPVVKNKLVAPNSIIVDAKSGVSGAGRNLKINNLFFECNESLTPYNINGHRHTPEIEKELQKLTDEPIVISFTPHLVPMNRGIIVTAYAQLSKDITEEELRALYHEFYSNEYFVKVVNQPPSTKHVKGSNQTHIYVSIDKRTNRLIAVGALDNLVKGASGQAVQNMNILFGFDEKLGLDQIGVL